MSQVSIQRFRGGFAAVWHLDGKRTRRQLEARTRAEAEAEALDVFRRSQPREGATVATIWAAYIEDREGRSIAQTMRYTGKAVLAHFGAYHPDQIDAQLCRAYTAKRRDEGRHDGAIWTELGHLRTALTWAVKARLIDRAPEIERPAKPAPKERYLDRKEIDRLLAAEAYPHIRLAVILMLATGARVGALLELTWDRVNLDRGVIDLRLPSATTRKGRAVVPINAFARDALVEARRAALSDHVIEWAGGRVKTIRRGFNSAVQNAGLEEVTPHVLRHTAGVHMAQAGVSMAEIAQYLGHSNVSVTERVYARFSPQHLQGPATALDFSKRPA